MPTIQELRSHLEADGTEQTLADVYAVAENQTAWLGHEYDEDESLKDEFEPWWDFQKELSARIAEIIKARKLPRAKGRTGAILTGEDFMYRYGYIDGSGWWIKKEG